MLGPLSKLVNYMQKNINAISYQDYWNLWGNELVGGRVYVDYYRK